MTTKTIRLAARKLDNPLIIMVVVIGIFILAGLIAAAGRYTPAPAADLRPAILVQTATAAAPIYVERVRVQYIVATPTAEPAPESPAPEPDAPPAQPTDPLPSTAAWPENWRSIGQPAR